MLPLRYSPWWLAAGLLMLAAGLVVALSPSVTLVPMALSDKLMHAAAFAAFMVWFTGLVEFRRAPRVALALAAYGLLIEVLQAQTATRQAEAGDLVADLAGVLLGWLLCAAGLRHWCSRVESWLAPPESPPPAS